MKKICGLIIGISIILSFCCYGNDGRDVSPSFYISGLLPLPEQQGTDSISGSIYIVNHFWNDLNFKDTIYSHNRDFIEQNFSNFARFLINMEDTVQRKNAVKELMDKAEVDTLAYRLIADVAYKFLYAPDAPMENEETYIPFLEIFSESGFLNEAQRGRNRFLLNAALKNRPGRLASDFQYISRDGNELSLYTTLVNGRILLIFYDPDCDTCKETLLRLASCSELNETIKRGELTVLAIYSGEDKELWEKTAYSLPSDWIVGYEEGIIDEEESYYFRSSPSIYILDEEKKVLIKDLPLSQLF